MPLLQGINRQATIVDNEMQELQDSMYLLQLVDRWQACWDSESLPENLLNNTTMGTQENTVSGPGSLRTGMPREDCW